MCMYVHSRIGSSVGYMCVYVHSRIGSQTVLYVCSIVLYVVRTYLCSYLYVSIQCMCECW